MKKTISAAVLLSVGIGTAYGQESHHLGSHHHSHNHGDVPIGVMGGHTHESGGVMFSYRYMTMHMDGNRDGKNRLSNSEVLANYKVTPTSMDMKMHMFGAMYAVNNKLTLMAMLPYVKTSMDHLTRTGKKFTTSAEGLGDIKLTGLYKIAGDSKSNLQLNFGVSFPTGSIDERDDTPVANDAKLPYSMQLGSGTYDLIPGIAYRQQRDDFSWGTQLLATIRLGENDNDYTLGDRVELSAWLQKNWSSEFSSSVRLKGQSWSNIDGADPDLNPAMISTADPELRAGKRFDLILGVNYSARSGALKGNRFALEIGKPVYQKLDGPQLETDLILTAGWQYAF